MKQVLVGVFAHPDDEAFGPSAYLYRQAHSGTDVHLVLVTDGEAGTNNGYKDLASQRLAEWQESGKRIGASSLTALHFADGTLCNTIYLPLADTIQNQVTSILAKYTEPVELTLMTFEKGGISGHLDHIATSLITTFVFERLRKSPPIGCDVRQLLYYCLPSSTVPKCNIDWIYMPKGYDESAIHLTHAYHDIFNTKLHIMQAHESQKDDMNAILAHQASLTGDALVASQTDHFILYQ